LEDEDSSKRLYGRCGGYCEFRLKMRVQRATGGRVRRRAGEFMVLLRWKKNGK
jgi:hypothetical protein